MGEVFAGRFELIDPIATGGMGTVWLAVDRSDGQLKAAKILRQSDAASLLRFVREQSLRIDHAHIVTPDSWAGVDDRVLFTMPLVRGGSVADLRRQHGALPVRWVALILDQTLQALEAVHAAGIVHRDVKPGNLLLEATGAARPHLRLTDFGIAQPLDAPRMTVTADVVTGTPGYIAPELLRGADPDPRSDLWAAGIVALELLQGHKPPADRLPDVDALRTGDRDRDALLDVIASALEPDPARRAPTAGALRARLAELGLDRLPPQPGESISIEDRFAATQTGPSGGTDTRSGGTPRTPSGPTPTGPTVAFTGSTQVEHPPPTGRIPVPAPGDAAWQQHQAAPRGSAVPGLLVLLLGLLMLAGAGMLWFG